MTPEEALKELDDFKDDYGTSFEYACPSAYAVIEDALGKQIPKKPTRNLMGAYEFYECPDCGSKVIPGGACNNCCKKIDWSESEEQR